MYMIHYNMSMEAIISYIMGVVVIERKKVIQDSLRASSSESDSCSLRFLL